MFFECLGALVMSFDQSIPRCAGVVAFITHDAEHANGQFLTGESVERLATRPRPLIIIGAGGPPLRRSRAIGIQPALSERIRSSPVVDDQVMLAVISLFLVLAFSMLITKIATIALTHTGLSRESARFQARSALTGVGFTTAEAEKVVNHPVRRRVLMLLMLLGNAGIVTVISSMILTFVNVKESGSWLLRITVLIAGVSLLWTIAQSQWIDRHFARLISRLLRRWTALDVRDYASLLHLGGEYRVAELQVQSGDWLASKSLAQLRLREEGVLVLGIQHPGGEYRGVPRGDTRVEPGDTLLLYASERSLESLDKRREGFSGAIEHLDAVAEQVGQEQDAQPDSRSGPQH